MFNKFSSLSVAMACIFLMVIMSGCATPGPAKSTATIAPPPAEVASSVGWWYARFRIHWPTEKPVEWHWDLLIADKIVAPVLAQYKDEIHLWRFHRRAVRDETGHQFSFLFYASAGTAYQIFTTIRTNELLAEMKNAGVIDEDHYDNPEKNTRLRIEDTSDARWPPVVQRNWPYFIMGSSQMWLNLISETIADMPNLYSPLSVQENEQLYEKVNVAIGALWEQEGHRAFLHHLSALFGYRPIIYYDKRMLKF